MKMYTLPSLADERYQFSRSVVSGSLRPHGPQHARPPCPSPTPRVYSNSCPPNMVMPSNHLILCRPILLLPSIFPSIRVFCNESVPMNWGFSFSWDVIVIQNHNQLLCYLEMFSPNGDICWLEVYGWSCLPSCSFFPWKELSTYLMPDSQPEQEPGEKSGLS